MICGIGICGLYATIPPRTVALFGGLLQAIAVSFAVIPVVNAAPRIDAVIVAGNVAVERFFIVGRAGVGNL